MAMRDRESSIVEHMDPIEKVEMLNSPLSVLLASMPSIDELECEDEQLQLCSDIVHNQRNSLRHIYGGVSQPLQFHVMMPFGFKDLEEKDTYISNPVSRHYH